MSDTLRLAATLTGLTISLLTVAGMFIAYGKWLEKLNGVGGRVSNLEKGLTIANAERAVSARQIDKLVEQYGIMLERLGEAKRSSEACHDDTEALGIRIGTAVSELQREVASRLTRVETILTERGGVPFTHSRRGDTT